MLAVADVWGAGSDTEAAVACVALSLAAAADAAFLLFCDFTAAFPRLSEPTTGLLAALLPLACLSVFLGGGFFCCCSMLLLLERIFLVCERVGKRSGLVSHSMLTVCTMLSCMALADFWAARLWTKSADSSSTMRNNDSNSGHATAPYLTHTADNNHSNSGHATAPYLTHTADNNHSNSGHATAPYLTHTADNNHSNSSHATAPYVCVCG